MPTDVAVSVAASITLVGQNFGKRDLAPSATIDGNPVQSVQWLSDTSVIVISNPRSTPGTAELAVAARGGTAAVEIEFVPSWHALSPTLVPSRGGNVTVIGAGFAADGEYQCVWGSELGSGVATSAERVSSSAIACNSPVWTRAAVCGPSACSSDVELFLYSRSSSGLLSLVFRVPGSPFIRILAEEPSQLAVLQSPALVTAGAQQDSPFAVAVQDIYGRDVAGENFTIAVEAMGSAGENLTVAGTTAVLTRDGVATFDDLEFQTATNTYVLHFSALGEPGVAAISFAVSRVDFGEPAQLQLATQPGQARGGNAFGEMPIVDVLDDFGNVVRDWNGVAEVSLDPNSTINVDASGNWTFYAPRSVCCRLNGTTSIAFVNGTAAFTDLAIDQAASGYQLIFTSSSLLPVVSSAFSVTPGPARSLYMVTGLTPPGSLFLAMEPLSPPPEIHVLDAGRNLVAYNASIQATLDSDDDILANEVAPDLLLGSTEVASANGVAIFSNLLVVRRRYGYFLTFRSPGLLPFTSWSFNIRPGTPLSLGLLVQPSGGTATLPLAIAPVVAILDAGNNTAYADFDVNASVWVAGDRIADAFLRSGESVNQLQATASVGTASFAGMTVTVANPAVQILFTSSGLRSVFSDPFPVGNYFAVGLFISQPPLGSSGGLPFQQQPIIDVVDIAGNVVLESSAIVQVSLLYNGQQASVATLSGTTVLAAANGTVQFVDLEIDVSGAGYSLNFSSPGLGSVVSGNVSLDIGLTDELTVFTQPADTFGGQPSPTPPRVCATDAGGNINIFESLVVVANISVSPTLGASLLGAANVSLDEGCAVFTDLAVDLAGQGYRLAFSAPGVRSAVSDSFDVAIGPPAILIILVQPGSGVAVLPLDPQPEIEARDLGGNRAVSSNASVVASLVASTPDAVSGDFEVPLALGIASFATLGVVVQGLGLQLQFSVLSASVVSEPFNISTGDVVGVAFAQQPGNGLGGEPLLVQPEVRTVDSGGNTVPSSGAVSVALGPGPAGATLSGTLEASIVQGVAAFTDLSVDLAAAGHTLSLCYPADGCFITLISPVISDPFNVSVGPKYRLTTTPTAVDDYILFRGGEPPAIELAVLDLGGNVVEEADQDVSIRLWGRSEETVEFDCNGTLSCTAELSAAVQSGERLISALLDISVACTDLDFATERISRLQVGAHTVASSEGFFGGPWADCYGDCARYESIVAGLEVAPYFDGTTIRIQLESTENVNFNPCDGHYIRAVGSLRLLRASPIQQSLLLGPPNVSFTGSIQLSELAITTKAEAYMLSFNGAGVLEFLLYWIEVAVGSPYRVSVVQEPSDGTGGVPLPRQPTVEVQDAGGNLVLGFNSQVSTVLLLNGTETALASVWGNTTLNATNGTVEFRDLAVDRALSGYTLNFTAPGLVPGTSATFEIVIGPATQVTVVSQPLFGYGGQTLFRQPVVAIGDAGDNVILGSFSITASIAINGGILGQLSGALEMTTSSEGLANFTDLAVDRSGRAYTLLFETVGLASRESQPFDILTGPAAALSVYRQPGAGTTISDLSQQPSVQLVDAGGNAVQRPAKNVTVRLYPYQTVGGPDTRLEGDAVQPTVEGIAWFYDLSVLAAGVAWQLEFNTTDGSVGTVLSEPFIVSLASGYSLGEGQVTLVGTTPDLFTELEQYQFVKSVADALGVNVNDVRILGIEPFSFRRRLLENAVVVQFDVVLTTEEQRRLWASLTSTFLRTFMIQSGLFLTPQDLFTNVVAFQADDWSGWWTSNSSAAVAIAYNSSDSGLEFFSAAPDGGLACSGTASSNAAIMACYDANFSAVGGATFTRSEDGDFSADFWDITTSLNVTTNIASFSRFEMLFASAEDPAQLVEFEFAIAASVLDGSESSAESVLYLINATDEVVRLDEVQRLNTIGAIDIAHHRLFGRDYLFVISHYDTSLASYSVSSALFAHDRLAGGQFGEFSAVQSVATLGAVDVEAFVVDDRLFFAVANYFSGASYALNSKIFELVWLTDDPAGAPDLETVQELPTEGARSIKHLDLGGVAHLLVSNEVGHSVMLLQWKPAEGGFEQVGAIAVASPARMAVFASGGAAYAAVTSANGSSTSLLSISTSASMALVQTLPTGPADDIVFWSSRGADCLAVAFSPQLDNPGASTGVYCSDASPPAFSQTLILPTASAGALMYISDGSVEALFAGGGYGAGVLSFQPRTESYRREGTHLEIALTPADPVQIGTNLSAAVQLYNGNVPARPTSTRTVRMQAGLGSGSLGEALEATVDADGFATFRDFEFLVPCVTESLQFVAPFITGVSSRRLYVQPQDLVLSQLASQISFASAPNASLFDAAATSVAALLAVHSTNVSVSTTDEGNLNGQLLVFVESADVLHRLWMEFNETSLSEALANAGLDDVLSISNFTFSSAVVPQSSKLVVTSVDLDDLAFVVVGRPARFTLELQDCSGDRLRTWPGPAPASAALLNSSASVPFSGARGAVAAGSLLFDLLFAAAAPEEVALRFALEGFNSATASVAVRQRLRRHSTLPAAAALPGSSAVVVSERVVVFGGNGSGGAEASVQELDLLSWEPREVPASGPAPSPRFGHAACGQGGAMFVFGGSNGSVTASGFYKYDPVAQAWSDLSGLSGEPSGLPRAEMAGTRELVLVHGGEGEVALEIPLYGFDPTTSDWQDLSYSRAAGLSSLVAGPVFMGASADASSAFLVQDASVVLRLNTSSLSWSVLSPFSRGGPRRSTDKVVRVLGSRVLVAELGDEGIDAVYLLLLDAATPYWEPLEVDSDVSSALSRPAALLAVNALRLVYVGGTTEQFALQDASRLHLDTSIASFQSAGAPISPPPVVRVLDRYGQLVTWEPVAITAIVRNGAGESIGAGGTPVVVTSNGIATFGDLRSVGVAEDGYIMFAAAGLQPAVSGSAQILPGPLDAMAVSREPVGVFPGALFFEQPVLSLVDSQGNVVNGDSSSSVSVNLVEWIGGGWQVPADAMLSGTLVSQASNGVVEWTDLAISGSGTMFALVFSRFGVETLHLPVNYTSLAETQLLLELDDGIWQSGASSSPAIRATRLVSGRAVPDNETLLFASIVNGTGEFGAELSGALNTTLSNGVAAFDLLSIDLAGEGYQIRISSADMSLQNTTTPFQVVPAPARSLLLVREPAGATGGTPFHTQPRIHVIDKFGNLAIEDSATVVVALALDASNLSHTRAVAALIRGRWEVQASRGVVAFTDLAIDPAGQFRIEFSADGLNGTNTTEALEVSVGPPASLALLQEPSDGRSGQPLSAQPVLGLRDLGGNLANASANGSALRVEAFASLWAADVLSYPALELLNSIPAAAPLDLLHVSTGERDFVLVANEEGNSWLTEFADGNLTLLQGVATQGAVDWAFVEAGGLQLLVVANFFDEEEFGYDVPSRIYTFDPASSPPLMEYQNLSTSGAYNLEGFQILSTPFLAIASHGDGTAPSPVDVFSWSETTAQFEFFASLTDTELPFDLEFFLAGSDAFLAVANHFNFTTASTTSFSPVFRWDGSGFALWQRIPTVGATSMRTFQSVDGGPLYLVVANYLSVPDSSFTPSSSLWTMDADGRLQFVETVSRSGASIFLWEPFFTAGAQMAAGATRPVDGAESAMLELYLQFAANASACSGCLQKIADTRIAAPGAQSLLFLSAARGQDYLLLAGSVSVSVYSLFHAPAIFGNASALFAAPGSSAASPAGTDTAAFTDLSVNAVGTWLIRFESFSSAGALAGDFSGPINITAGFPAALAVATQPSQASGGTALGVQPVIAVVDAQGNPVLSAEASGLNVSAVLVLPVDANSSAQLLDARLHLGARAVGAVVSATDRGRARFQGLAVDAIGEGYVLNFTSDGLDSVLSDAFEVTAGAPAAFRVGASPAAARGGEAFGQQPALVLLDAGGNVALNGSEVTAAAQLAEDPTGVAALGGWTSASSARNTVTFTNLAIDLQSAGYRLGFTVTLNSNGSTTAIHPFEAGDDLSEMFTVTAGAGSALHAEESVVAAGAGRVLSENATVTLQPFVASTDGYFVGFRLRIRTQDGMLASKNPFYISEQSYDNATGNVSVRLLESRDFDQVQRLSPGSDITYEVLTPAGFSSLSIWGSSYQQAAHGTYEVAATSAQSATSVYRQQPGRVIEITRSGLDAVAVSGLYGRIPSKYRGLPVYARQGGSLYLFSVCNASASTSPVADTTGCWAVATEVGADEGFAAVNSSEAVTWGGAHELKFDTGSSSWKVTRVGGSEEVLTAASSSAFPWTAGQTWSERIGAQLSPNAFILVAPEPSAAVVDKGGNLLPSDPPRSVRASLVLPSGLQAGPPTPLLFGAKAVAAWADGGQQWLAAARFSNTDASCAAAASACGGGYGLPVELLRWDTEAETHALAAIDNGDLRGSAAGAACPDGWECNGTVSWDLDRGAGASSFPAARSPQPLRFFGEAPPAKGPGLRLGPGSASVAQPFLRGAAAGDSVLVTFHAALDWDGNSTSRVPAPLGTVEVSVNGTRVFGPVTPGPYTVYGMQEFSFRYTASAEVLQQGPPTIAFAVGRASSDFASDEEPRILLGAVDLTAHSSSSDFGSWELEGSANHTFLHGVYTRTDLVAGGEPVYWRRADANASAQAGDARAGASAVLAFSGSLGVWMAMLESGVDASEGVPSLVSAGSLGGRGGPWREVLQPASLPAGVGALYLREGEGAYAANANISLRSARVALRRTLRLPAAGAVDVAAARVARADGEEERVVVVANYFDGAEGSGGYQTESTVYRVAEGGGAFEALQGIATAGAADVEAFAAGGAAWLAVANFFDGEQHRLRSPILRWSPAAMQFEAEHSVASAAALQWQHLQCGAAHLLALLQAPPPAHNLTGADAAARVKVWRLDVAAGRSELRYLHAVPAPDATALAAAEVGGQCLLVVAAGCSGCSALYRFDGAQFEVKEQLPSTGSATGVEFLFMAGVPLLAVTDGGAVRLLEVRNESTAAALVPFTGFAGFSGGLTGMGAEDAGSAGTARHVLVQGKPFFVLPSATETRLYEVRGKGLVGGLESAVTESVGELASWTNVAARQHLEGTVAKGAWEISAGGIDAASISMAWEG